MFVAQSSRTMANAKFKKREDDGIVVVSLIEKRRNLALEAAARDRQEKARRRAMLEMERKAVNGAILAANIAARRFNEANELGGVHKPAVIIRRISQVTGVSPIEMMSESRSRRVVFARHAVMYWLCRLTLRSLPQVGQLLGNRDHTTILHGKEAYVDKRAAMGRTLRRVR